MNGIYVVYRIGTPFVYIGESKDCESRFGMHNSPLFRPGEIGFEILLDLEDGDKTERLKWETRVKNLLVARGFEVVSLTASEIGKQNIKKTPESLRNGGVVCQRRRSFEERSRIGIKAALTRWRR
jgi:predicted GIY-YIG superfamily endonuclease